MVNGGKGENMETGERKPDNWTMYMDGWGRQGMKKLRVAPCFAYLV